MVDVHILGHDQPQSRFADAQAQIVVVEESRAIAFVKRADAILNLAASEQTESRHSRNVQ